MPILPAIGFCYLLTGCSRTKTRHPELPEEKGPPATVRVPLATYGLPNNFFQPGTDTKCASQIIGYRFVVWLDDQNVAVGFNTSPNCRQSPDRKVSGTLRVLIFDTNGKLKANRELAYLADGNGEIVADGEAMPGPNGTLLIRIESVNLDEEGRHESKSGVRLLDTHLRDVAQLDVFMEQTTLVDHAIVAQDGFTVSGPRTYSIFDGPAASKITSRQVDWPAGAMDRKFGERDVAFMVCGQQLTPGKYTYTNVIHSGAQYRCALNVLGQSDEDWTVDLADGETAALVGILQDGSMVGNVHTQGSDAEQLILWQRGGHPVVLPWIPPQMEGTVETATSDFSRYGVLATNDAHPCNPLQRVLGTECNADEKAHWFVFDRRSPSPLVDRVLPKNGRAALSPDGTRYASFEEGELRIYSLVASK